MPPSSESTEATTLLIGTPCYGRMVTDLYAASLLKLQLACQARGIRLQIQMSGSDALITRARQNIVANFLASEAATHLLFIDADIGFEPDQVFRLLDFNVPVSAAVYPVKRIDWQKLSSAALANRTPLHSAALTYNVDFPEPERVQVTNGFARVLYAATGFFLLQRHVLLAMVEHYPELRYQHDHKPDDAANLYRYALFNCMIDESTSTYLSEDYSFCKRWTDTGGEIWIDLESRLTHVGAVSFQGDLSTQFTKL